MVATRVLEVLRPPHGKVLVASPAYAPVITVDANELFGLSSGNYVAVVHGNIADISTNIVHATPHCDIDVTPFSGPAASMSSRDWMRHSLRLHAGAGWYSPVLGNGWALPFYIVDGFTLFAGEKWELRARMGIPNAQPTNGPASARCSIENLSVSIWCTNALTSAGVGWQWNDTSEISVALLSGSGGTPIVNCAELNVTDELWAAFWSARLVPGTSALGANVEPASVRLRAFDPIGNNRTWPERGFHRRFDTAAGADPTQHQIGGFATRTIDNDDEAFGVSGRDPRELASVKRVTLFAVELDELQPHAFSAPINPSEAFDVYGTAGDHPGHRIQFQGTANRLRALFVETAKADVLGQHGDPVGYALDPGYPYADPIDARLTPTYSVRGRLELTPDYRTVAHSESVGPVVIDIRGKVNPLDYAAGRAAAVVPVAELGYLSLSRWHGIADASEGEEVEVPGPRAFVSLTRETLDPSELPPFPSPPTTQGQVDVLDPHTEAVAQRGDSLSMRLCQHDRFSWRLQWTIDTKRHPDRLTDWRAFLRQRDRLAVAWQSPLDDEAVAYLFVPDAKGLRGPSNGVWSLDGTVIQARWTEEP